MRDEEVNYMNDVMRRRWGLDAYKRGVRRPQDLEKL